ncbi:hypothetical protein [Pseudozobellia thermophila]|uniref:Uncharacterized protein n=1 Tax=Pseudozobellia thermophila TaxID=192903 RepID=A0A1M6GF35_9FLAO|nr:hypothetical protein [Pseudozobellia thermophila]SHJ08473.1 hypothetical protein SAMN04488513_102793 [Pseudozobellia thermophila]
MELIEKISCKEPGTHCVLVKDSWQVVKLNSSEANNIDNLRSLYINKNGGLAISLLLGRALLIVDDGKGASTSLKMVRMVRGTSYYLTENVAYHIVMEEGSELFGVGSPDVSAIEMDAKTLDGKEIERIKKKVNKELKN